MTNIASPTNFVSDLMALLTRADFYRGSTYVSYLDRTDGRRQRDEAPVVDTTIVGPILGLLGFAPGERDYNRQKRHTRPDFAPNEATYGTCFMVEDLDFGPSGRIAGGLLQTFPQRAGNWHDVRGGS